MPEAHACPQFGGIRHSLGIGDSVTAGLVVAESVSKADLGAEQQPTIELNEIPLVSASDNVIVVSQLRRRHTDTVFERVAKVSGVRPSAEHEDRLLENRLGGKLEGREKVGTEIVLRGSRRRCTIDIDIARFARAGY